MHPKTADDIAAVVLIDIAVIVIVARGVAMLARRVRQPAVIGEIIAGLLLGPSLLGKFPHDPSTALFPTDVRPYLNVVAQIGLVIFMFIVGLELDLRLVKGRERIAGVTSVASIVVPLLLGVGLASFIHGQHGVVGGKHVNFWPFALFIGASMSITAFPVLARIVAERGMQRTELGTVALACASVDDILAWTLLTVVVALVNSSSPVGLPRILGEGLAFVLFTFLLVKPLLRKLGDWYDRTGQLTPNMLALLSAGFLGSAFVTEKIGLHQIFGAFLFGVAMPRDNTAAFFRAILERLEQVSVLILLPVFFVVTGLGTNIAQLGPSGPLVLVAVLGVAIAGKFVGATSASRVMGMRGRKPLAIGVLMNTRGLTELVILNVGVSLGVLDQSLFTILVVMAVVTTMMTEPLLRLVYPEKALKREILAAQRASLGLVDAYRVVAAVSDPKRDAGLVDVGAALAVGEDPSELVLARFIEQSSTLQLGSGLAIDLADVAAGLTDMQALADRSASLGVPAAVRSQSTGDLAESLIDEVEMVDGNVLLLPSGLETRPGDKDMAGRLARSASATLALWADPGGTGIRRNQTVTVIPGHGRDFSPTMELAIRTAVWTGGGLVVSAGEGHRLDRRAEPLVHTLSSTGLDATVGAGGVTGTGPITVIARSELPSPTGGNEGDAGRLYAEATGGPVLVVQARDGDLGEGLTQLMGRLSRPDASGVEVTAGMAEGILSSEGGNE